MAVRSTTLVFAATTAMLAALMLGLPASAQREAGCAAPAATERLCELTGHKLLPNPNAPDLLILQIETKQGPHAFVADRASIERFAKELIQSLEDPSARKL